MAFIIGIVIGLVLGLTGAGGSVFAVPLLISLLQLPINQAVGVALGAVAVSAFYGSAINWRSKNILWPQAIIFAVTGSLMSPLGKIIGDQLPAAILLVGFNLLAVIIAVRLWLQTVHQPELTKVVRSGINGDSGSYQTACRLSDSGLFEWRWRCVTILAVGGAAVGVLSGLFGVGGGFLIVPLLLTFGQAPPRQAVATSLVIIACVSATAFLFYVFSLGNTNSPQAVDWSTLAVVAGGGLLGMIGGQLIGKKIAGPNLQKLFAISLVAVSLTTLARYYFQTGS